jgi:hypothetical protein
MKLNGYILLSFIFGSVGVLSRIVAFQNVSVDGSASEWVYDLNALGEAFFYSAPFIGLLGILTLERLKRLSILQWCRIPTSLALYLSCFNTAKELSGLNNDNGIVQFIFFFSGITITILTQYAIIRKHTE